MKGYSEHRGHCSKLDFDQATGQFISKPIAAGFAHQQESNTIIQKIALLSERQQQRRTKKRAIKELATIGPAMREDVGLTEFYAVASQM